MNASVDCKQITCILPKGKAIPLVEKLHREKNIDATNVINGRGSGIKRLRVQTEMEVEILEVIVNGPRADEIFEFIYFAADIGQISSGFMYQCALGKSTRYDLPELPEEKR